MATSREIRQQFIDFFVQRGHTFVPSSPVVPHDDPTLMFTNAGMNQFKPIFLGTASPNSDFGRMKRTANTQKCIRAGGKHNDLDDVGRDTYHHTFFEMLGNWSFGDYFKKEAIEWAWELLTKVWGIDPSRLHATYFQGDPAEGLEPDTEAADLWRKVPGIDASRVHPGNKKDNFWEMGDTGPCGPCSEIHIDLTPDKSGGKLVNAGDARVMEIWNLVFIQFNRGADGKLTPLPAKHVDTGMGFERLCAVLQGTTTGRIGQVTNYDTDVFAPIFAAIQKRTGASDYRGTLPSDEATKRRSDEGQVMVDVSYRVIADHIRTLTFAITDGAMPSNEGRGYVLRRILRRAVRYGRQYLNMTEPFLCDLVQPLVEHMGDAFPELRTTHGGKNVEHVTTLIRDEESSFLKTLDQGIKYWLSSAGKAFYLQVQEEEQFGIQQGRFEWVDVTNPDQRFDIVPDTRFRIFPRGKGTPVLDEFKVYELSKNRIKEWCQTPPRITGADAFRLHDTYGFPIDLTQIMADEYGVGVDTVEFERLLADSRHRARSSRYSPVVIESIFAMSWKMFPPPADLSKKIAPSDDMPKYLGDSIESRLVGLIEYDPKDKSFRSVEKPTKNVPLALIFEKTCFYSEQGGQVGDTGLLVVDSLHFPIHEVVRLGNHLLHGVNMGLGQLPPITIGETYRIAVNPNRNGTMQNHTATHILNWALREVLCPPEERTNPNVQQKGSLVDPEKTRFDFSHSKALSDEELARIESLCNEQIAAGLPVYAASREEDFVDQAMARKISTLRAVFGEKYPDKVRVVSIGVPVEDLLRDATNAKWMQYSVEFCGGTHVANTREIEHFVLTHEEAVAKGIRRVVGISGEAAKGAEALGKELLAEVDAMAKASRHGGELDAARVSDFQQRFADATIPLRIRHQLREKLAGLQEVLKKQQKQQAAESSGAAMDVVAGLLSSASTIGGVTVVVGEVPSAPVDALRAAIDWIRNKTAASAVLLATVAEGKVTLMAGMSKDVVARKINAGDLIKEISPLVGGKGGGRPDMAQGGGPEAAKLPDAITKAREWLHSRIA